MPFAILVIGSPGSGKSTFCHGLKQLYAQLRRPCVFINLDPANDSISFTIDYDVRSMVKFEEVSSHEKIGPNATFIRCMELVEENVGRLEEELKKFNQDSLFVFDCPGQVELYTMHPSLKNIIARLDFRFAVANIVDGCQCQETNSFISLSMLTLQSMLNLGFPQVNFLSKIDLLSGLENPLSCYCFAELSSLRLRVGRGAKYSKLTDLICELIEEHCLVSFVPIAVEDKESILFASRELDRVVGHTFGGLSASNESINEAAYSSEALDEYIASMERKYLSPNDQLN
jgi:GTPase SAR1 family protein